MQAASDRTPDVKVEPPLSAGSPDTSATSNPDDPFVVMLKAPESLRDRSVFAKTASTVARIEREGHTPAIAFRESDELTDSHLEIVRAIADEAGVKEIRVHGSHVG